MFEKEIVVDGKGHLMGRLAAYVAKELLCGQRVVVVRVEQLVLSGKLFNRRVEFLEFRNKISNVNPRHGGPYHYRSPSKMFWRAVRGMLPHKTRRGEVALERLKIFEGCPYPYSHKKRMVVPRALKVVRMKNGRKSCLLGELSALVGWNKGDLVKNLEEKRLEKAEAYHSAKEKLRRNLEKDLDSNKEI